MAIQLVDVGVADAVAVDADAGLQAQVLVAKAAAMAAAVVAATPDAHRPVGAAVPPPHLLRKDRNKP
jgi:hypothetical protein